MRGLIVAAGLAALVGAGALIESANAMTLPAGLSAPGKTEQVRLVCSPVWNGYSWEQRCYRTGPRAYYGGPAYYGAPAYYGPRPFYGPRRGFYGRRYGRY